jgi:hypothetical protein
MVSAAERSAVTVTVALLREEIPDEIDLDGHRARQDDDACNRAGERERANFEGT